MTAPTADLVIHTYLRVPVKGSDAAPVRLLLGGVHPYDNLHRPSSVSMSAANKEAGFTSTPQGFCKPCEASINRWDKGRPQAGKPSSSFVSKLVP